MRGKIVQRWEPRDVDAQRVRRRLLDFRPEIIRRLRAVSGVEHVGVELREIPLAVYLEVTLAFRGDPADFFRVFVNARGVPEFTVQRTTGSLLTWAQLLEEYTPQRMLTVTVNYHIDFRVSGDAGLQSPETTTGHTTDADAGTPCPDKDSETWPADTKNPHEERGTPDYAVLSIRDLKTAASKAGIRGYGRMTKDELRAALASHG